MRKHVGVMSEQICIARKSSPSRLASATHRALVVVSHF